MTMLPASPFIDSERPIASTAPTPFQLDEAAFWHAVDPTWSWQFEDDVPLFIGAPSDDFIQACRRDLVPTLEQFARLG